MDQILSKGVSVIISEGSRLSFAPNIEKLDISKDEYGVLRMKGSSKDGKESIDFSYRDGIVSFELCDEEVSRSYNNKMGGKFSYRDLKTSDTKRYFDYEGKGAAIAKEMAGVMDKLKEQYKSRQQSNTHSTPSLGVYEKQNG